MINRGKNGFPFIEEAENIIFQESAAWI